ncbi:MAG: hypothetical protein IKR41_04015 [Bacteroidales bacterium]|jgi:hypothetical protein|nr:hypothetical protein [Bacteroidales bacterium]
MKRFLLLSISILLTIKVLGQQNISFGLIGPGFDFGGRVNSAIYETMPGEDKVLIMEPGFRLGVELYATPATSFKFVQAFRIDCMRKMAFSSQIMIRFRLFKVYKHSLSFGFGPTAFYRQTWANIPGYTDEKLYKGKDMQHTINWVSAELEYNYVISKYNDLSFCVTHQNPDAMGFAIGLKHWFTRKSNKCSTCPSFK